MSVTTRYLAKLIARDGFTCHYCGVDLNTCIYAADHVIPRADGGKNRLDNLVLACRSCNSAKRNRAYAAFKAQRATQGPWPARPLAPPLPAHPATNRLRIVRASDNRPLMVPSCLMHDYARLIGANGVAVYTALVYHVETGAPYNGTPGLANMLGLSEYVVEMTFLVLGEHGLLTIGENGGPILQDAKPLNKQAAS